MFRLAHIVILLLAFVATGYSQVVPYNTESNYIMNPGEGVIITPPRDPFNYLTSCNGRLVVISAAGTPIHITGQYDTEPEFDVLSIFDGITPAGEFSGQGYIDLWIYSGTAQIRFVSDHTLVYTGFDLMLQACQTGLSEIEDVTIEGITSHSAHISWHDWSIAEEWTVCYGTNTITLSDTVVTQSTNLLLDNLDPGRPYYFKIFNNNETTPDGDQCKAIEYKFRTECETLPPNCVEYDDLNSCHTMCYYGNVLDPALFVGVVDSGFNDTSRHTVITDTTIHDRIVNELRVVPSGFNSSVRLGNADVHSRAERISYEILVDTLESDMLIFTYAPILQDGGHPDTIQPKVRFQFNDAYHNLINSTCTSAEFVAGDTVAGIWNHSHDVDWQNWSKVALDLTPYEGQTIRATISSFDCAQGEHFGYVYFAFMCGNKVFNSTACGETIENTFTAPEGFRYRWFRNDMPLTTLSTEQSLHVTTPGIYHCALSFPSADNISSCNIVLSTVAGARYPKANFDWFYYDTSGCTDVTIRLVNKSRIAIDIGRDSVTSYPCESASWIVDDTSFSSDYNPRFTLLPGYHTITLISMLADGDCTDTLTRTIWLKDPANDTIYRTFCQGTQYSFYDTLISDPGIYVRDSGCHHRTLFLFMKPMTDTSITHYVIENDLPYTYGLHTFTDSVDDFLVRRRKRNGCDSLIHFNLHVWRNTYQEFERTVCDNQMPYTWCGETFNNPNTVTQYLTSSHGADSTVQLTLLVRHPSDYYDTAYICNGRPFTWIDGKTYFGATNTPTFVVSDSSGCDSTWHLALYTTDSYFHASIEATPNPVTYENSWVTLNDPSGSHHRNWLYGDMTDTAKTVNFLYPFPEDTVPVTLIAYDDMGCPDTAWAVIRTDVASFWVPNVFTPDESSNKEFFISSNDIVEAHVWIFNRAGTLITDFDALTGSWDGTFKGKPCPQASYVWLLEYTTKGKPKLTQHAKGTITILR